MGGVTVKGVITITIALIIANYIYAKIAPSLP
jgi:hypothetical protein